MVHNVIMPELAQRCTLSGTGWDQGREREEGRRLRRLVRAVVESGSSYNAKTAGPGRRSSQQYLVSAGTDGTVETSPNLSRPDFGSTPTTAGTGEDSPGRQMPMSLNSPASNQPRRQSTQRNFTIPSLQAPSDYNDNHRSAYSERMLKGLEGGSRSKTHSPSASGDVNYREAMRQASPGNSPGLPSAQLAGSANAVRSSQARYYSHKRAASSESNLSVAATFGSPPPSGKSFEPRRNGYEGPRAVAMDSAGRQNSNELPGSAKEHHFKLPKIFNRKKKDDPSPDDTSLDDDSSPVGYRQHMFSKSTMNSSDTSLHERPSSQQSKRRGQIATREPDPKRFSLVTPDGWNYRLVDISYCFTALEMKEAICQGLGIDNGPDVSFHLTAPGQTDHEEALTDKELLRARDNWGDAMAQLKFLVSAPRQFPHTAGLGLSFQHGGLASPFGKANFASSEIKPREGLLSNRLDAVHDLDSAGPQSGESTLVPAKAERLLGIKNGEISAESLTLRLKGEQLGSLDGGSGWSEAERRQLLEEAAERHREETKRKQESYLAQRQKQLCKKDSPSESGTLSIRREGIIDFDERRDSPYEDKQRPFDDPKRPKVLVPRREAPPAPPDSSTLHKANSLMRRPGEVDQRKTPNESKTPETAVDRSKRKALPATPSGGLSGISAALVGAGNIGGLVGAPNRKNHVGGSTPSSASPDTSNKAPRALASINYNNKSLAGGRSPGGSPRSPITMSKGDVPFYIPDYDQELLNDADLGKPALSLRTDIAATSKARDGHSSRPRSPDLSPSTSHPNASLSREPSRVSIYGPTLDFKEEFVPFSVPNSLPVAEVPESDEDSDGDLFAMPIKRTDKPPTPIKGKGKESAFLEQQDQRPTLTLKTSRSKATLNASGQNSAVERSASTDRAESEPKTAQTSNGGHPNGSAASATWSASSPDEANKFMRRESFASDIWANRPPPEALVEHLDEFFPNVNLDQPVAEDDLGSPPGSPSHGGNDFNKFRDISRSSTPMTSLDETNTLGSDESTLKRGDTIKSIAQRNLRKSGGLGRTKSIREQVKDAYHPTNSRVPFPPGPSRVNTLRMGGDIVRRKSTKMFNARIEQVKPSRMSKLIQLETIPQDSLAAPQRQPTFKWVKGQLIGKGTFGRVYLGMNLTTGELLAVKQVEVNPKAAGQDKEKMRELVKALDIEIDTMQHLDHPNIVTYLGCERKEFSISIFLEYIPGGSIGSCLRKHGRFEEKIVSSLTRQTLSGLAYLHSEGILHRDLKADNILLNLDGTCLISDFGISKKSDNIYGNDITNSMQGSVFWMAPEVVRAQGQGYSAKVDIWSLGCVVLEMFAGRRPWSKEEAIGAIYKLGSLNQAPPIPDDVSRAITPQALSFMYDCFTIDPTERPTAETLLRAPFCFMDTRYNFLDTDLYAKIRGAF